MSLKSFVDRLGYENVPIEINKLRCRVNYHALKFLPETERMADILVSRMHNRTGHCICDLRKEWWDCHSVTLSALEKRREHLGNIERRNGQDASRMTQSCGRKPSANGSKEDAQWNLAKLP